MKFVYKGNVKKFKYLSNNYSDIPIKPYRDIYCVKYNGNIKSKPCFSSCNMRYEKYVTLEIVENYNEKKNKILSLCRNFKPHTGLIY